jgi:hypothetical protein
MNTENNTSAEAVETPLQEPSVGVRLYVTNIPHALKYEMLWDALSARGKVIDMTLKVGFAICRVSDAAAANLLTTDVTIDGRVLRIQLAK